MQAKASVVVVHGLGEHSGRYEHVFDALNQAQFHALAVDLRGFGRSGGARACVDRFDDYLDDVDGGFALAQELGGQPARWLLGHSMGGLIVARYAQKRGAGLSGIALSSPGFAIKDEVPLWKHSLGVVLSRLLPRFSLPTEIRPTDLTRDLEMLAPLANDDLVVSSMSARLYIELLGAQGAALAEAGCIDCPVLLQAAEADQVVDVAGSYRFLAGISHGEVDSHFYPDLYHEIFNEHERAEVLGHLVQWLGRRVT